ncbi:zinc finger protein 30-like [Schistocerca cancellata]|uniref:zinc finger protein 30-like n=1 Tax=Schistocerca cancellata TaxID=274614 RepID=UPI002118A109|nr:zinc finger protein 30-like [Schistocerca cancellata]
MAKVWSLTAMSCACVNVCLHVLRFGDDSSHVSCIIVMTICYFGAGDMSSLCGLRFYCHQCGRTYKHKDKLRRHLRLECGVPRRFTCFACSRSFKHKHHLTHHQRQSKCASLIRRLYECEFPAFSSTKVLSLVGGETSSVCGLRFYCHQCGRTYQHKDTLRRHLRLECGVPRHFTCFACSRNFKHKHHLTDHQRKSKCAKLIQSSLPNDEI